MKRYIVPIVAMLCISILETACILKGINGAAFGVAVAAIGGICGYYVRSLRKY